MTAHDETTSKQQILWLDPAYRQALAVLADQDTGGSRSRLVRDFIERQMVDRFGPQWRDRLNDLATPERDAA